MENIPEPWRRLALASMRRVNLAWVVELLVPFAVGFSLLLLAAGLLCRWYAPEKFGWVYGTFCFIAAGITTGIVVVQYRRRRLGLESILVRLDRVLGLNNALSTAYAGRGAWPPITEDAHAGVKLNSRRIAPPVLLAVTLILAGLLIPVKSGAARASEIPPPRSHEQIAEAIAKLEESDLIRKEDVEELANELAKLQAQSPEEWYRHSSLEAADHLQEGMRQQLQGLAQNLAKAASSLQSLESGADSLNPGEQQQLAQDFKSAMQGLKDSPLGLNEKLMSALSKVDPSSLKSLDVKDLSKMMERLKQAAGECKKCAGDCGSQGDAQSELEKLLGDKPGRGRGGKDGGESGEDEEGEDQTGKGGIDRGPGVAPLPLSNEPTDLKTNNPDTLESQDLSRTRPGDTIGTADTENDPDKSSAGPQAGGGIQSPGKGGDSVWKETLLPGEKAVLRKYFK